MSAVRSIRINEDLRNRLEAFANRHKRTPNFVINEALQTYLEMWEREEAVIEAAKESWAEFQTTHQAADWGEVRDWSESWGGPSEAPEPQCRKL
jgi:predicted transcriptional regulator